ncbi:MAG TPA: tetratricopeptide repeat protein [Polyangiaceae bacterium]|nr:tetratricopeptide repeat protein [Polyangiaceae bacterium]
MLVVSAMVGGPHRTLIGAALVLCVGCAASPTDRARSLVRQHREDAAAAVLRDRIAAHPEDIEARRLLVRVLGLTGDLPAAREQTRELTIRLPPGDPTPYVEIGHALELAHRYEDALAAYDEAASVAPTSPLGPREGGMRCARWGEADDARPRLEEAIRRGARDAETWHALGLVRLNLGDLPGADDAYRSGVAADPRGAENWLGLASVAVVRGDAQGALDAYDQVLARRPRFGPGELGRAWALIRLGRPGDAARALDRAEELGAPAQAVVRQRAALHVGVPR